MKIFSKLRSFDAYPKTLEDFQVQTYGGAAISVVSAIVMFTLLFVEIQEFTSVHQQEELFVDTTRGQRMKIHFDVTFPKISCSYLSVDAIDVSGSQQFGIDHNIFKQSLNLDGEPLELEPEKELVNFASNATSLERNNTEIAEVKCRSCYGAETEDHKCCNTCDEVRDAYQRKGWRFVPSTVDQCKDQAEVRKADKAFKEGCQIYGHLEVNRVSGSFHIAPGRSFAISDVHVHDVQPYLSSDFNLTHRINKLSFGAAIPGAISPLENTEITAATGGMMFTYYVKAVPTVFEALNGTVIKSNQYSATLHTKVVSSLGEGGLPGVFFSYELSPIMVKIFEYRR
ncbi:hypothetical protein QYM36_017523 [Artemia franciscana]|nr:hypothetical protein QYM36_017523 [Artemia franciscana]